MRRRPAKPDDDRAQDDRLARMAAKGDASAWTLLVDRHLAAVAGFAWYKLGDRAEADDIAQETFIRLMRKTADWRPGGPALRTWLFRVAFNLCIDSLRARRTVSLDDSYGEMEARAEPENLDERLDQVGSVRRALARLPDRQRAAIILIHYQGTSNREAAEVLDISVDAVESLLARARRTLRRELDPLKLDLLGTS